MKASRRYYQSDLMKVYNHARKAANAGKLDIGRVNRAFGIMLQGGAYKCKSEYQATKDSCLCPDARRGHVCKHRIAHMMQFRLMYPYAPLSSTSDGGYWCAEQFRGYFNIHQFDTVTAFDAWKASAVGKIVMVHNATGRRNLTEMHWEDDYVLPIMPPTMAIYQELKNELCD